MCRASESPIERMQAALVEMPDWLRRQSDPAMGDVVLSLRRVVNRCEGFGAEATRRFEKSGGFKADGALGMVPWLKDKAKLSGGEAMEHVQVARQLEQLPRTEEALARGEIGFAHAVAMARTADHIGVSTVRKAEASLLNSATTLDAGAFVGVVKDFEHRVDAEAMLAEANRAHQRRYLSISEPVNGLARIDGQLVPEAAATIRSAIEPFMKPRTNDDRTPGQRMHDALAQVCERTGARGGEVGHARPLLIITADVETLAGIDGAPAGELQSGGKIPAATVQRYACDSAITRITGLGELEQEITHAARTVPPPRRRALVARDRHCVFPGCDRPAPWCDGHHLTFWGKGGPTKLDNLGLLCKAHHRKVHEEGWTLSRSDGRWSVTPPLARAILPRSRSS